MFPIEILGVLWGVGPDSSPDDKSTNMNMLLINQKKNKKFILFFWNTFFYNKWKYIKACKFVNLLIYLHSIIIDKNILFLSFIMQT